jgi:hypothetical protein
MLTSILKSSSSSVVFKSKSRKAVSFKRASVIKMYEKPADEFHVDLYGEKRTNNPTSAEYRAMYHELNEFKLREMQVHPESRCHNNYRRLAPESFEVRVKRIHASYGPNASAEDMEEMRNVIYAYDQYKAAYQEMHRIPKAHKIAASIYNYFADVPYDAGIISINRGPIEHMPDIEMVSLNLQTFAMAEDEKSE